MPTTEQQPALVAALELGSEVPEIGTGGWAKHEIDGWEVPASALERRGMNPDDSFSNHSLYSYATETDYYAACYRVARWLRDEHSVNLERYKDGKWLILKSRQPFYPDGNKDKSFTSCWLNCPDDELAALVAAAREVMK